MKMLSTYKLINYFNLLNFEILYSLKKKEITLGICVMERKRKTKRFSDLVERLDVDPISVMIFNETIMEQFDVR